MRKTFNDTAVERAVKAKIDALKSELKTIKELSEIFGFPSTNVVDEFEERFNRLIELADGVYAWEESVVDLENEILSSMDR